MHFQALPPQNRTSGRIRTFSRISQSGRTLRRTSGAGRSFPGLLDQRVHRVATKKNDTRVFPGLYSTLGKCSYWGPEECFSAQWCYLSASMRLLIPTLMRMPLNMRCRTLKWRFHIKGFWTLRLIALKVCDVWPGNLSLFQQVKELRYVINVDKNLHKESMWKITLKNTFRYYISVYCELCHDMHT